MKSQFCGYDIHPAANLFPMMTEQEFDDLVADIKAHGQILPIILYDGKILDGRNRAMACHKIGASPKVETWHGEGSPIDWVLSVNFHRRNLTYDQRVAIAAEATEMKKSEAKERQRVAVSNRHAKNKGDIVPAILQGLGEAVEKAADEMDVSPRAVYEARKIQSESPETFAKLKSGEVTLQDAKRAIRPIAAPEFSATEKKKIREAEEDSEGLWLLKDAWRKAKKTERKLFLKWIKSKQ